MRLRIFLAKVALFFTNLGMVSGWEAGVFKGGFWPAVREPFGWFLQETVEVLLDLQIGGGVLGGRSAIAADAAGLC